MHKKTLRWISTLLTLTILLQLSPIAFFSALAQTADASGSAVSTALQYEYTAPQASSGVVESTVQDTFTDSVSKDILNRIEFPEQTADDERYIELVMSAEIYSALSDADALFLTEYTGVPTAVFTSLEESGYSLSESILYTEVAGEFGCEISDIISADLSIDEARDCLIQIRIYNNIIRTDVDADLDASLKSKLLQGFSCDQVLNAYGMSQVHSMNFSSLLSDGNDLSNFNLPENELTQIGIFSNKLGVSSSAVANHIVQNNINTTSVVGSSAQIELAVAQILSQNNSEPIEGGIAGETIGFPEVVSAPYLYSQSDVESVNLNSGALVYEVEDYVLSGVNGLDLVIGRRYDSQSSNVYTAKLTKETLYEYAYFAVGWVDAYMCKPDGGFPEYIPVGSSPLDIGPFETQEEAAVVAKIYTHKSETPFEHSEYGEMILVLEAKCRVVLRQMIAGTYYAHTADPDTYLQELYGLGQGWSFGFSSVQISDGIVFLHLWNGATYEADWNSSISHLKGYSLNDKIFSKNITEFTSGGVSSYYRLSYQDGRCEYFSSEGKLIGICDRYGNSIRFEHSTVNGLPYIKITDTLGRITTISGNTTGNGHVMTVTLPNEIQLAYEVEHYAEYGDVLSLSEFTDAVGNKTGYHYTLNAARYNLKYRESLDKTNIYVNLTAITHPTGLQTRYTYDTDITSLGSSGATEIYRISSRADDCGKALSNQITYTYSEDDNTGYPTYTNPDNLPSTFTYSATVTDPLGIATTTVFDKDHLAVSSTVTNGETTLQSVHYEYTNKLPTKTITRLYNAVGDYIETIEAAEYDSKGNVTAQWSSYAAGDTTNPEYKTTYTYDSTYGIPLTQTYKTNPDTTILVENTLDSTGKNIASTKLHVNGVVKQRTDYTYDSYGNITQQKRFYDNMTDYALTEYTYQNGAYLTQEKHTGILSADGTAAAGTPGQTAGTIVTSHTYDSMGRRISTTDGNGNMTAYTYDAAGNVTQITNPDNTTVTHTRDYTNNKVTVTDENGAQVTYIYTPLGLEYETVDTLTNLVINRKEYDAQSRLSKYYDYVYGAVTEYTYDNLDRVTSETVYQGTTILAQTTYAYDDAAEDGLYQKVTKTVVGDDNAPSIVTTQYTDKHGNVVKTGKFLDGVEYFDVSTYDYVGNVLTTLTAADAQKNLDYTAQYVYNETNQVVSAYNALGQSTTNTYNALGQLVSTTDYAGTPTTYTYDALGRLLTQTITIQDGVTATNKYDYDPAGNIIREYKPTNAVGFTATWAKTEYSYDSRQRLTAVAQYQGSAVASVTRYTYDGVGNTLTMTTGLSSLTDTTGNTTAYTYDRFGNVLTTTDALGKVETNTYTDLGRLSSTVDRNGTTTSYAYDALGRVLLVTTDGDAVSYSYTQTGQVQDERNSVRTLQYTYDELGRNINVAEFETVITVTLDANGGSCEIDSLEVCYGDTYDLPTPTRGSHSFEGWYLNGELIESGDIVDQINDCTLVAKWELISYRITVTLDPSGGELPSGANAQTAVAIGEQFVFPTPTRNGCTFVGWYSGDTCYQGGAKIRPTTNCTFRARWTNSTNSGMYTIWYHGNGGTIGTAGLSSIGRTYSRTTATTLLANPFIREYYAFWGWSDSPTGAVIYEDSQTVTIGSTTLPGEVIDLWAVWVPASDWVSPEPTDPDPPVDSGLYSLRSGTTSTGLAYTKTYTYDLAGNRTGFTVTGGGETLQSTTYTYDNLNRLSTVSEGGTLQATYTYDTNGNRQTLTYANGVVESYQYNKANWITGLTNSKDGTALSSYTYTYYASGSQKSEATNAGALTSYIYDDLGRLTREIELNGLTLAYTYDANGNRTQMTASGTDSYTTAYTYDANNRLTTEAKTQSGTTTTSVFTYDDNGNLLTELDATNTAVVTHSYDGFNRLISSVVGTTTIAYAYNPQGIRTSRAVGTTTTQYLLDGGNVVGEVTDGTVTTYLRGANLISSGDSYYLYNAHGDVVQLTNASGAVTKSYDYDAFGNEKNPSDTDTNPFRYCGEYYDTETGLYYLRARYYDPTVGRFTQEDTHWNTANMIYGDNPQKINEREDALGLKTYSYTPQILSIMQAGNLYVYCTNDPVTFADQSGNVITPANVIGALIGAGIGALIGIAIANSMNLTGWKRAAVISGGALLSGVVGWFAGPAIVSLASKVAGTAVAAGKLSLTSLSTGIIKALNLGQRAAQNAINKLTGSTELIKHLTKHLSSSGGKYAKFTTSSAVEINNLLARALGTATDFVVNTRDSFYTIVNMGEVVGTKGETCIKIVFSIVGEIITAYPVK